MYCLCYGYLCPGRPSSSSSSSSYLSDKKSPFRTVQIQKKWHIIYVQSWEGQNTNRFTHTDIVTYRFNQPICCFSLNKSQQPMPLLVLLLLLLLLILLLLLLLLLWLDYLKSPIGVCSMVSVPIHYTRHTIPSNSLHYFFQTNKHSLQLT